MSEGQKIKSKISPVSYHLMKPHSALLETCVEKHHLDQKSHHDLAAVDGPNDPTIRIATQFVQKYA